MVENITKAKIGDTVTVAGVEYRFDEGSAWYFNGLLEQDVEEGVTVSMMTKLDPKHPVEVPFDKLKAA